MTETAGAEPDWRPEASGLHGVTRAEHLQWCKERALEYVDQGDLLGAQASLASDLRKHAATASHPAGAVWMTLVVNGRMRLADEVRSFIEGVR